MAYTGTSVVDYLKSVGQASDYSTRAKLAASNGISNYSGTAAQNTQLLSILNKPVSSATSIPTPPPNMTPAQQTAWNNMVALIPTPSSTGGSNSAPTSTLSNSSGDYVVGQVVQGPGGSDGSWFTTYTYLGNDQWEQGDTLGREYPTGSVTTAQVKARALPGQITATETTTPTVVTPTAEKAMLGGMSLDAINAQIDASNLPADQKAIAKMYAQANFTKNPEMAQNIMAAIETSTKFATPEFKAAAQMIMDGLDISFNNKENDLEYQKGLKDRALAKLEADYSATSDKNTFDQNQLLDKYKESLKNDSLTLADNMAAGGFTNSSKRDRATTILNTENSGLVESANKQFAYQAGNNARTMDLNRTDTAAEVARLRQMAAEGKLALLRDTESKLGSDALAGFSGLPASPLVDGFNNVLGGQMGSQNYDLTKAITSNAMNFF